ncbi:MAG: ATP-binding protein, partial [Bacteroidetes bacterium]
DKNEQLVPPFLFFRNHLEISIFHGEEYDELLMRTLGKLIFENRESPLVDLIESILIFADSGIVGIDIATQTEIPELVFPSGFPEDKKHDLIKDFTERFKYQIKTKHRFFEGTKEQGITNLPLNEQSTGTIKFFNMLRLVLQALAAGNVLIVDELDKSLHPDWTKLLISLFHYPETNPKGAQLIFATHDVSLMSPDLFGRDQLYLVQKDLYGSSKLYSIADYKKVSPETPFEKWYLSGRFQAIPNIAKQTIQNEIVKSGIFDE